MTAFPRYREHVSAQCPYSVTGGITKEQLFVLLHRIESFFVLAGKSLHCDTNMKNQEEEQCTRK